jgi:DNA polymerase-3 subunit gamma/tau
LLGRLPMPGQDLWRHWATNARGEPFRLEQALDPFMSYVVLARKWRPMSFRDLIGQEHVSRTLANAIARERVAHAFLFTGVRGVGKTTSARILAKALNCLSPVKTEEGGIEPCLACAACSEIAEGVDMDVREIDGASYTGVDEIRKLQESLPYRPARDRYKIFIVDEVHMLSQNAWNALLKTLEEPPPHVKFILATTEVHKVPVTILSRVQRFDFKMIPSRLIGARIRYVLAQEQIEADDRAVALVAREAAGSMRDALSLLDQVIAFNPHRLAGDEVSRVLGVAGYSSLTDIAEAVLRGEPGRALDGVAALTNQSCDLIVTARDLLGLLRDLVVAKVCREPDALLDLADDERQRVKALAAAFQAEELLRVQRGFAAGFDDVSRSPEPRSALEMLLARLALRPALAPLDDLIGRLAELEARLAGGKPPPSPGGGGRPSPGGGGPRPGARPVATAGPGSRTAAAVAVAAPPVPVAVAAPVAMAAPMAVAPPMAVSASAPVALSASAPVAVAVAAPVALSEPAPAAVAAGPATAPVAAPVPAGVAGPSVTGVAAPSVVRLAGPIAAAPSPAPAAIAAPEPAAIAARRAAATPSITSATPAAPAAELPASVEGPPSDPAAEASIAEWRRVLDGLGQTRPDLVAILKHTVPLAIGPELLTLGYEAGNVLEVPMRSPECAAALREAAAACFGREPKIVFQAVSGHLATLAESDRRAREREKRAAVDRAEKHPSVRDAAEILGARVKRIEIGES